MRFRVQRFPHLLQESPFRKRLLDQHGPLRAVVIVDYGSLSGPPAKHQHLYELGAADLVTPVSAVFKTEIGTQFFFREARVFEPVIKLSECRR